MDQRRIKAKLFIERKHGKAGVTDKAKETIKRRIVWGNQGKIKGALRRISGRRIIGEKNILQIVA